MKRRTFLAGVAGTSIASTALSKPAIAYGKKYIRMVTTWPRNFPGLGTSAQRLANEITLATDNQLKVKLYEAEKLIPAFDVFDAVSSGNAEMYHGAEYYWTSKSKGFAFFSAVPFGLTASEMFAWLQELGGQDLWDELAANYRIKPLCVGSTGTQMGGWFNREINTISDFKGLKIRMPGLGGEVMKNLGAEPISLPGGKIIQALKSGKIDAAEWIGPWSDRALGLDKVAKNYYSPGFHEPGTVISAGINLDLWNSLSASHRRIIQALSDAEAKRMLTEFNARNSLIIDQFITEKRLTLRKTSAETLKELGEISGIIVADVAHENPFTQKIYDSFINARRKLIRWAKHSEEAFLVARRLPFAYGNKAVRSPN